MPAIVPFIPLIISAVGTGISTYSALKGPPSPPKAAPEVPKPPDQSAEKQAILASAPNVQERLGGAVAPEFFAEEAARVSGNPQDVDLAKQVLGSYLGLGSSSDKQSLSALGQQGGQTFSSSSVSPTGPSVFGGHQQGPPSFFESIVNGGGGGYGGGEGGQELSGGYF